MNDGLSKISDPQERLEPIPQLWVKDYIDQMILFAASFYDDSSMKTATMLREEHAADLIEAFRQRDRSKDDQIGHRHDEAVNKLIKRMR